MVSIDESSGWLPTDLAEQLGVDQLEVVDRTLLIGGYSGATVERLTVQTGRPGQPASEFSVVLKQTDQQELDALRLLADSDEAFFPRLLAGGRPGASGECWVVMPWYAGSPIGEAATVPADVFGSYGPPAHRLVPAAQRLASIIRAHRRRLLAASSR